MSPLEINIGVYTIQNLVCYYHIQGRAAQTDDKHLNNFFIQFWFEYCNHMNDIEMTAL